MNKRKLKLVSKVIKENEIDNFVEAVADHDPYNLIESDNVKDLQDCFKERNDIFKKTVSEPQQNIYHSFAGSPEPISVIELEDSPKFMKGLKDGVITGSLSSCRKVLNKTKITDTEAFKHEAARNFPEDVKIIAWNTSKVKVGNKWKPIRYSKNDDEPVFINKKGKVIGSAQKLFDEDKVEHDIFARERLYRTSM
jgi:hypothetical protein